MFLDLQGVAPTTITQVYTVGASNYGLIRWISFHNLTANDQTISWYSKKVNSLIMDTFLLPSNHTIERSFPYPLYFAVGEGIEIIANNSNSIHYKIVGEENAL